MSYEKSNAFVGLGLVLSIGNSASPVVFTEIGEVRGVPTAPVFKNDTTDVTNVQSVGGVKEFLATLTDPGEVAFSVNLVPGDAGQQAVIAAGLAKTRTPFQLTLPPESVEVAGDVPGYWLFTALVTEYQPEIPLDKEASASIKLKISGLATFVPESV